MTQREAVDALFAACPAASAEELVVDWDDSVFIWAGALARHLVEGLSEGRTEEVRAALEVAEQLLTTGDAEIENLIQIGLFEGIQNVTGGVISMDRRCGRRTLSHFSDRGHWRVCSR
jgi:hypothetical protein